MDEYDYIGNYFNGLLSQEEMKRFDEKIQQDPAFAEDVAFYCSSLQQIKNQLAEEKKKRFRELYQQENLGSRIAPVKRLWPYIAAAAIIAGIVVSLFIFTKPSSSELADQYIQQHFMTLPVNMGSKEDDMQKGLQLYNENNLPQALQQFEKILQSDTTDFTAKKLAGIVSLRMKQYDKALAYFMQLENTTLYTNPGKFYRALTLMERNNPNDKQEARLLLEQVVKNDFEGKEKAAEWLKKW